MKYFIKHQTQIMLYERKRRKEQEFNNMIKNNQDSTLNSDKGKSNQKVSSLSKNKKKPFTKIINKRTFNTELSQNLGENKQLINPFKIINKDMPSVNNFDQSNQQMKISSNQEFQIARQEQISFNLQKSHSNSTFSLQLNNLERQGTNSSRKKFKLYCELKRKKQVKKSEQQKQQKNYAVSTASQSWLKNSVFSKNSQRNDSNSTNKSKDKLTLGSRKKINLAQKIKLIRSKQKNQNQSEENSKDKAQANHIHLKLKEKDIIGNTSQKSTKRSKNSQQKKQSTLNIKKSDVIQQINSRKNSKITQTSIQSKLSHIKRQQVSQKQEINIKKSIKFQKVQNRILPEDSQIIEEQVKKLSQIKQQKNQDTISRSIKALQLNSIDHSISKNNQKTSMHLSINSICNDIRRSFNCILQTTQMSRQSALRRQIQSSLSSIQRTRQKINIQKFKSPKNYQQIMGSSKISNVQHNLTVVEKIQFHIQIINTLSNFVYKSTQLEYLMEDWDELNFLIYKKFYIQRTKVLNFLKKYPIKNPFCIKRASIQTKQILKALKQNQKDIKSIKQILQKQNCTIKKNLQVFFSQFDKEKQGQKINLFEYDNFSHWIYKELWDQIQLFSYSQSHNRLELQDRICKSLQAGFLISQLNGNYVTPFQDAQIASHQNKQKIYIDDNIKIFQRYVLNKKK